MTRLRPQSILLVLIALLNLSSYAIAVGPSIVVNGDFEAGSTTDWVPNGWSVDNFGRGAIGLQSAGTGAIGSTAADTATISQVLTTTPGTYYDLTFYAYADGFANGTNNFPNELKVRWGGGVVADYLNIPTTNPSTIDYRPGGPMTLFTVSALLATTPSTTLSFGGRHDPAGIFIDNVSVNTAAVPEPSTLLLLGLGAISLLGYRKAKSHG